jgi:hypothetical protein
MNDIRETQDMIEYWYKIDQRPANVGGGWELRLLQDGEEVGGGVYPAGTEGNRAAYTDAHD